LSSTFLHESVYSEGPASAALRVGGPLLLRPGMLVYGLGLLAVAAAGVLTLAVTRDGRIVLPLTAIATVAGVGAMVTDLGGARTAKPELRVDMRVTADVQPPQHEVTVSVANAGGRGLLLASNSSMWNAYALSVEKRIGKNSGVDVGPPVSVRVGAAQVPAGSFPVPRLPVQPGQTAVFVYRLPEGEYRATLKSAKNAEPQEKSFALEPISGTAGPSVAPDGPAAAPPQPDVQPQRPTSALMQALSAEVTMRGILASGNRPAQFSIAVTLSDGATNERSYAIGDEVFTNWVISEFNPSEQTVTLSRGTRIVILRRGETVKLDPAPKN
jgi:hypothetical protein